MTVVKSLTTLAKCYNVQDFSPNDTVDELIDKISGGILFGSSNVTPASPTPATKKYWGTAVQDMQTGVTVTGTAITGTLKKLTTGSLVDVWGEGYFLALKFTKDNANITSIKVGLRPSASNMPLQELDADMDGVFKITDKDKQVFIVSCSDGSVTYNKVYDLSGLTLSDS